MSELVFSPDWTASAEPFRHTWEGVVNIDQFRWMVRKDCLEHLRMAHDEIGARHVRAVGMLCDEMRVIGKDPKLARRVADAAPRSNFQIVDYVIDELLDIGIRPMITTTFVPSAIAGGSAKLFETQSITSLPKNLDTWADLVSELVRHLVDRYGREEVSQWYFEVWNEPNLRGSFWDTDLDNSFDGLYGQLWKKTWQAIKGVDDSFRIGGPSAARGAMIDGLLEFSRREHCEPDYIISHFYNNDSSHAQHSPFLGPDEDRAENSPNFARGLVRGACKILEEHGFDGELHWNEWGASWFPSVEQRESPQEAAWACRTIGEVGQLGTYYAYWALSDIYNQAGYGRETFHGNYGMLNLQGLRKPIWFAHQLLSRLGDKRLPATGGTEDLGVIATRSDEGQQALVFASQHNNYTDLTTHSVRLKLPAKPTKTPRLWRVNDSENNILAHWKAMGSPDYLRRDERDFLRSQNMLTACSYDQISIEETSDGCWATFKLPAPGIALVELID